MEINRNLIITKNILWFITGCGLVAGISRLIFGLGATTALTDVAPWGLWVGFDVLGGVALAAGGFIISGMVYIFHLHEYRPLLRSTILTAFLGYLAVIVGLSIDLGRPWMIWSPTVNWQIRSALFEVAWCVMLYTTVLALEFAPVIAERFPQAYGLLKILQKITIPLVIAGIMLSSMHQSTLGTIFVAMPFRIHPLWYSPWLPLLFFSSAFSLGLAMIITESIISGWLFRRELEHHLLWRVARILKYALGLHLLLIFAELTFLGKLRFLFISSWASILYGMEILISTIIPVIVLASLRSSSSSLRLLTATALVLVGFTLNRINVAIVSMFPETGQIYFPTWVEIIISFGIIACAILIFFFFVENFKVYEKLPSWEDRDEDLSLPVFDRATEVWLGPRLTKRIGINLLFFILGASLTFSFLPENAWQGAQPQRTAVDRPRGLNPMVIDGNRNKKIVLFDHNKHIREQGVQQSCPKCHHMLKPWDEGTACSECHRDMFLSTLIFDHDFHQKKHGGNKGCRKCHQENKPKTAENIKACKECHTTMIVKESRIKPQTKGTDQLKYAVGYREALHGLCINCHQEKAEEYKKKKSSKILSISPWSLIHTEEELIFKERLHFCPTCHREVRYTDDPIPMIVRPRKEKNWHLVPLFLSPPSFAGEEFP